jgi:acyl-[acyl carrier protein]--UDP-N-acetylglucosamine O-acyltransferase
MGKEVRLYGRLDGVNPHLVTIGDYSIIGAGSVVTKDVPPYSIAAGNLARILRQRDAEEVSRTTQLLKEGKSIGKGCGGQRRDE